MKKKLMPDGLNLQEQYEHTISHIEKNVVNKKEPYDFDINDDEKRFIAALIVACDEIRMSKYLKIQRLCDKTFNIWCNGYVGKIKLRGRRSFMQIILKNNNVLMLENKMFDEYIKAISKWKKYIIHMNEDVV